MTSGRERGGVQAGHPHRTFFFLRGELPNRANIIEFTPASRRRDILNPSCQDNFTVLPFLSPLFFLLVQNFSGFSSGSIPRLRGTSGLSTKTNMIKSRSKSVNPSASLPYAQHSSVNLVYAGEYSGCRQDTALLSTSLNICINDSTSGRWRDQSKDLGSSIFSSSPSPSSSSPSPSPAPALSYQISLVISLASSLVTSES